MRDPRSHRPWLVLAACVILGLSVKQDTPSAPGSPQQRTRAPRQALNPDQKAIQTLVARYFTARGQEDLEGAMACWSAKSPQRAEVRRQNQELFAARDGLRFRNFRFARWNTAGERAGVRVRLAWGSQQGKSNPTDGSESVVDLELVRVAGSWRLWLQNDPIRILLDALHAVQTKEERARLLEREGDLVTPQLVRALNGIAEDTAASGDFDRAYATNGIALEAAETMKDKGEQAWCFVTRSVIQQRECALPQALASLGIARRLFGEIDNRQGSAAVLDHDGRAYEAMQDYPHALQSYFLSEELYVELGDRAGQAQEWAGLASVSCLMERYHETLLFTSRAVKICRELGDRGGEARALLRVGEAYLSTSRYFRAWDAFQGCMRAADASRDGVAAARARRGIGQVALAAGEALQARAAYRDALDAARQVGDRYGEAAALAGLGRSYQLAGEAAEARKQYEASLNAAREIRARDVIISALLPVGELELVARRTGEARATLEEALRIAREIPDRAKESEALILLGEVHTAAGRYVEALEQYRAASAAGERLRRPELAGRIESGTGEVYRAQGKWDPAIVAFYKAIDQVEAVRLRNVHLSFLQAGLFGQRVEPYYSLVDCLIRAGAREAQAFAVSERARSRTLLDAFPGAIGPIIRQVVKEGEDIIFTVDQLEFNPVSLAQLNQTLFAQHPKLCVLAYLISKEGAVLFVITRGEEANTPAAITIRRLSADTEEVELRAEELRARCASSEGNVPVRGERLALPAKASGYQEAARWLYQALLAPAANEIARADQIIVIPHGRLSLLPFQALIDPEGLHLIERCAVSYAPSATALLRMAELADERRSEPAGEGPLLLAMGRPAFAEELPDLPASETEVKAIAALFGGRGLLFIGKDATESKAKAELGRARYLHFATHALVDRVMVGNSAIALARGPGEDGMLRASEIEETTLKAEMVVLSACETSLGRWIHGEGVLGLAWALLSAGVPSTVVTQWSVADQSTSELMVEFYRGLFEAPRPEREADVGAGFQVAPRRRVGISKAEALRLAQLALLRDGKHAHPYYWAPFILVGDWR